MKARGILALAALVASVAIGGCTLLLDPDDELHPPDSGPGDGGMDAGDAGDAGDADTGVDAGVDGGPDACVPDPGQSFEVSCNDGTDNDCDGMSDCDDFDCGASGSCCSAGASSDWASMRPFNAGAWQKFPDDATGPRTDGTNVTFRVLASPQALVFTSCAPLAYGARFETDFSIQSDTAGDYAALLLTPSTAPPPGGSLPAELAVVVSVDRISVQRAGVEIGGADVDLGNHRVELTVTPGFDEDSRGVMRATVFVGSLTQPLVDDVPFMPLDNLWDSSAGCDPDGLFLALEGTGTSVVVNDAEMTAKLLDCDNPSQFDRDTELPLPDLTGVLVDGVWRSGCAGEPSLAHFLTNGTDPRLELWVHAADVECEDEIFLPIPYTVGAAFQEEGLAWQQRTAGGAPTLLGPVAREPSVAVPEDASGALSGTHLYFAYALPNGVDDDVFDIEIGQVRLDVTSTLDTTVGSATAVELGCSSVRDPSLVPLSETPEQEGGGFLLFFTCQSAGSTPDTVGVARFDHDLMLLEANQRIIPTSIGPYASRGALSPEVVFDRTGVREGDLRIWFLARNAGGEVTVAFAHGRLEIDQLPKITPFAGNPVLTGDDPVLGGDCTLGCNLEALAVTETVTSIAWPDPLYLLLIDRTRYVPGGLVHEMLPLTQLRPAGSP